LPLLFSIFPTPWPLSILRRRRLYGASNNQIAGKDDMLDEQIDHLLTTAIRNGGLTPEQIARIVDFRLFGNRRGYLLLEDLPIGDIPATPQSRDALGKPDQRSEHLLLQATALLGEPIGYRQESDGSLVNNFFPQRAQARAATSDSFDTELDLHTENAFHAVLPDYLVLLCLRQDPAAEAVTYIASVDTLLERLNYEEQAFFLREPYNFLSDYGPRGQEPAHRHRPPSDRAVRRPRQAVYAPGPAVHAGLQRSFARPAETSAGGGLGGRRAGAPVHWRPADHRQPPHRPRAQPVQRDL